MKKLVLIAVVLAAVAPAAFAGRARAVRHPAEPCSYSLAPAFNAAQVSADGLQHGTVLIFGQTAVCSQWMAYSSVDWITVEAAPLDAQPAAYVTVAANPLTETRSASLTIAGIRLDVTQGPAVTRVAPPSTGLVVNGTFDTDLANWGWPREDFPNGFGSAAWAPDDANGNPASGSILLRNSRSQYAFQRLQCIPVTPRTPYLFGAKVRVNNTPDFGEAVIAFVAFKEADCSGPLVRDASNFPPALRPEPGVWKEYTFAHVTGSSTRGVTLVIGSAANISTFDAWFDDVFVKP
jgi:hypothetical protein